MTFLVSIGIITFVLVNLLWCSLIRVLNRKIIELAGAEIQKMRINLQKMQQRNHELAQSNSQMLAVCSLPITNREKVYIVQLVCGPVTKTTSLFIFLRI